MRNITQRIVCALIVVIAVLGAFVAWAGPGYTSRVGIYKQADGTLNWGTTERADWDIADSTFAALGVPNTFTTNATTTFQAPWTNYNSSTTWTYPGAPSVPNIGVSSAGITVGTIVAPSTAAVIFSSGTLVVQSTSTAAGNTVLGAQDASGKSLLRVLQGGDWQACGNAGVSGQVFQSGGPGACPTWVNNTSGGLGINNSWTGTNSFYNVVTISSMTDTITGSTHTLSGTVNCANVSCDLLIWKPGNLSTSYFSIAGLPANAHLQLECSSCTWVTSAANLGWIAQFNGDASTDYATRVINNCTSLSQGSTAAANKCDFGSLASCNGTAAGAASDFIFDIFTYTNGHSASGQSRGNDWINDFWDSAGSINVQTLGTCRFTKIDTAINQVTFQNTGGTNLHIGTLVLRIIQ